MTDHRCLAGSGCRGAVSVDDPTTGQTSRQAAVIPQEHGLCDGCRNSVQYAIEDLPTDYVALHVSLGEITGSAGSKVTSTPTPAVPIDVNKYALMTAISDNLEIAAEIVSETLNCDPPKGAVAQRLHRSSVMVSTNLEKLLDKDDVSLWVWEKCDSRCGKNGCDKGEHLRLSDRDGIQTALLLKDLHRRARASLGEFDKVIRLEVPCGQCGAPSLQQDPSTGGVRCRECGRDWAEELFGLAGRMIKRQQQEKADMAINQELQQRAEQAEWLFAELHWKLSLGVECTELTAAEFTSEILSKHTKSFAAHTKMVS